MAYPDSQSASLKSAWWKRGLLRKVLLLLAIFWLIALPLPGPMQHARTKILQQITGSNGSTAGSSTAVAGTITLTDSHGSIELKPTECISGHPRSYYGVSVTDPNYPKIESRVVLPESGSPHVTLSKDGMDTAPFDKATCITWDVDIHEHGHIDNIVEDLQGHAKFDCVNAGAHLVGNLTFRSCH